MAPTAHANDEYVNPGAATSGPPIPPEIFPDELQAAREAGSGESSTGGQTSSGGDASPAPATGDNSRSSDGADAYSDVNKPDLETQVKDRGLEDKVVGTGSNGNVVADDLRKVLRDDDAEKAAAA